MRSVAISVFVAIAAAGSQRTLEQSPHGAPLPQPSASAMDSSMGSGPSERTDVPRAAVHDQAVEISELRATLDDNADPPHADSTPAVSRLCELGLAGLGSALDLLDAPSDVTRLHAQRVVECVVYRRAGWIPGRGFPSREAEDGVRGLLTRM